MRQRGAWDQLQEVLFGWLRAFFAAACKSQRPRRFLEQVLPISRGVMALVLTPAADEMALPKPCSRHANVTICSCLLAQGWQSTSTVSILNKRSCCWMLQLRPRSDFGRLMLLVPSYAFAPSFGSVTGGTEGNVGIYTTGV